MGDLHHPCVGQGQPIDPTFFEEERVKNSCKDCAAFAPLSHECRRHAPVMVPVPQVNPMTQQPAGFAAMGLYPATNAEQWCLDFVPAPPAVLQ